MDDVYSVVEGRFGTVEVREISHNLIIHAHPHLQLGYWMGGGTAHTQLGAEHATYSDAHVVGVNRYQSHDFTLENPREPAILLLLYIHQPWLDDMRHELGHLSSLALPELAITPAIRMAAWQLMQKIMYFKDSDMQNLEACLLSLLRLTLEQTAQQMRHSDFPLRRKLIDYRLRLALVHMQDHFMFERSIGELAKLVGLSRSRMYELFQSELNSSPQVIWNSMRMKRAVQSVGFGVDDLATVASKLGFSTAGNFSRFFRSIMGVSPLVFRKNNIGNKSRGEKLMSFAYTSHASHALTQQDLEHLLKVSRARNAQFNVTGVLLYVNGCFMQYLEGAQRDLFEVIEFITTATQHHQIKMGEFLPISKRAYPDWTMAFISTPKVNSPSAMSEPELHEFLALGSLKSKWPISRVDEMVTLT